MYYMFIPFFFYISIYSIFLTLVRIAHDQFGASQRFFQPPIA